ncbi:MAG: hypothetical protein ACRDJ2_08210 [Actinomycetota bacterium]
MGTVLRFTSRIERVAIANGGSILMVSMTVMVAVGGYTAWQLWRSKDPDMDASDLE